MCSQRVYLLKLLRDQDLPRRQLNTVHVFDAVIQITLCSSCLECFYVSRIEGSSSFVKRAFKCFCSKLYTIEATADDADMDLFCKMANPRHCV